MPPRLLRRIAALCIAGAASLAAVRAEETPQTFTFEDYYLAPVRIHLLASTEQPELNTTLTEPDVTRILSKVNRVWSQAGICFYPESVLHETAAEAKAQEAIPPQSLPRLLRHMPEESRGGEAFHLYYVKEFGVNGVYFPAAIFVKDAAELRPVAGGIDEPIPRVTSHELGHALGLKHRQDTFNLMASGTTGTSLNAAEIGAVRARVAEWPERFTRAADLLMKADALAAQGKPEEAQRLYVQLAALPLEEARMQKIRAATGPDERSAARETQRPR